MKNYKILWAISLLWIISSCNSGKSLQEYIVEKQQDDNFISIDLPASIITLKEINQSDELAKTLKSIKKFNFLGLQVTPENKEIYTAEKQQIKQILLNKKFKELIRAKTKQGEVTVKYIGTDSNIDEVIFFGSDQEKGLAVVRIIGENMNPAAMLNLINKIKIGNDSTQLNSLHRIFENYSNHKIN